MRATLQDLRKLLERPRNIAIVAVLIAISIFAIATFGYPTWRRFVIPSEIFITGYIGTRIASRLKQAKFFTRIVLTASRGVQIFAVVLFGGAFIDSFFFGDIGYALFTGTALLWLWVNFSFHRVDCRLRDLPEEKKLIVTESTDVILLQMDYRSEEIRSTLDRVEPILERYGIVV